MVEKFNYADYVLTVNDEDLNDVYYEFKETTYEHNFKDTKTHLKLSLYNECFLISFYLDCDLNTLNNLDDGQYDITDLIMDGFGLLKLPDDSHESPYDLMLPHNNDDDMKKDLSSFWIQKQEDNKFLFKFSIPTLRIFSYFYFKTK